MYQALYRTYRPEVFDEILGQEHIVRILRHQLESGTEGHAYLLCGTRGTGKTTTARILAKGVNCLSEGDRPCGVCANCKAIKDGTFIDVIEIDAASNNGVENIRELRESVNYPPALGRKKVYIIDEVHMLSTGAFNALLKTLEEPPEHVMFILATTEPQKLPATILSRCMRLDFRRVPESLLKEGMRTICNERGTEVSEAALGIIAANADGSVRDGLSILDQCLAGGKQKVDRDDVLELLGTPSEEVFIELTHNVAVHNTAECLIILDRILSEGKEVRQMMKDWLSHYRNLLITKFISSPEDMLNMSAENVHRIREQADVLDVGEINVCIMELSKAIADAKWSTQPRILLELAIVKMSSIYEEAPVRTVTRPVQAEKSRPEPVKRAAATEAGAVTNDRAADIDRDRLWNNLLEQVTARQADLMLMRQGVTLYDITDEKLILASTSGMTSERMKKGRQFIEEAAEKLTGRKLTLEIIDTKAKENVEFDVESLARQAENALNLNVDLK